MSPTRPILAVLALLAAPGPWLLERSLAGSVARRVADPSGRVSLDAGGLRIEELSVRHRGLQVRASRAEVRPAWDGVDIHLEGLKVARTDEPPTPEGPAETDPGGPTALDTHGLTVRVQATGTTVLTAGGVTALLDDPSLTIGADGVPHASVGLTIQHARGSVHSVERLRAMPRGTLRRWTLAGTVRVADGPPLRLRADVDPNRVRAELEHEGGGWIHLAAWPRARVAELEADRFALHGLGRLASFDEGNLRVDASDARLAGRLEFQLDPAATSVHADDLHVFGLRLQHPKLAAGTVLFDDAWIDGDASVTDAQHFDADVDMGHGDISMSASASRRPGQAAVRLELAEGSCQRLFDALPGGFADAMRGTRVRGTVGGHVDLAVDFAAARARAATLREHPLAEPPPPGHLEVEFPFRQRCSVTADPSAIDIEALRGPYRHRFEDATGTPRSILVAHGAPHTLELGDMPLVAGAFVTLEDTRFFEHDGLDLEQVANAVWHNLAAGQVERGASTITQQAARNLFLGLDRTAARKLQEAFVATRIDASVGKERLLEIYLNIIELAPGVHGVEDAAQFYFGRSASDLTPLQATHLAMLAPAPRTYSERFVDGTVDEGWRTRLDDHVRRLARHRVIDRRQMLGALRGELDLIDRR